MESGGEKTVNDGEWVVSGGEKGVIDSERVVKNKKVVGNANKKEEGVLEMVVESVWEMVVGGSCDVVVIYVMLMVVDDHKEAMEECTWEMVVSTLVLAVY